MGELHFRDVVSSFEGLVLLGVLALVIALALVICWPMKRRDEFDAMQQPYGDQPWWRP